ncbi:hypothetical protein ACTFIV_002961 [Dictyostelium citrinum]
MTKKIDKNSFIQRYLEKTNCSHWKLDENNDNDKEKVIGLPSLEFLYEIQKSISFKLANKYKYISTTTTTTTNNDDYYGDDEDDYTESDDESNHEQEEENNNNNNNNNNDNDTDEESEKKKRKKVSKRKSYLNTRSTCSGLLKMNSKNSINRFPLSQPCLKPEIYNERCGPDVLMSLGVLYQQILISQIKSLNSFQK